MSFYWESFVFAIIAFGILYYLLNKYAFGPLFGMIDKRREYIQNEINSAEESRKQAEQFLQQQKQAVEEARDEAAKMIEQAKLTSSRQAAEIIDQARAEAARLKEDALKEIENEKNKAIAQLRSQVSAMSVMIASKIIEKQIDEQTHQQLVDQYLAEVGDKQ